MLQPETWLRYRIVWKTITYEIRNLEPYMLPLGNTAAKDIRNVTSQPYRITKSTYAGADTPNHGYNKL